MESLSDEILVKIFKNFDLKTRVEAAKTCKRWRRLIFDSEAAFEDDISEVRLDVHASYEDSPAEAKASARSVLAHLDQRVRLNFKPQFVENDILDDPKMRECFGRFEKFVLLDGDNYDANKSISSYWSHLPTSTKHVSIDEYDWSQFDLNVFSGESMQLESLYLGTGWGGLDDVDPLPMIVLPPGLKSFKISCPCPIRNLLHHVQLPPSLVELDLFGMEFCGTQFLQLLRLIRDALPNLERLRLRYCDLVYLDVEDEERYAVALAEFRNKQFLVPLKRIELDRLAGSARSISDLHFRFAVEALLEFCTVESISITASCFVEEIFHLTPMIVDKAATLELSIGSGYGTDIIPVPAPTELARIVTKFTLFNVQRPKVFRPMFVDASFDRLTEMRLERCYKLGDAELAIVAGWCKNLENLYFEPHYLNIFDVLTNQCLLPFLGFWDDRRSKNLVIECLKPAAPFGGFKLPADGDTGGFTDDKRWARYRKKFSADGQWIVYGKSGKITLPRANGTRLVIWDSKGKSMIITDYKRNVDRNFKIDLTDGGCRIAETRGPFPN